MGSKPWNNVVDEAIDLRHAIHRRPELAYDEYQTASLIRDRLDELGIPWQACAVTGTLGRLAADKPGRHIALRGDIDALPINEITGKPYSSEIEGCMHACGHDGHTATLLGAAAWLKQHESELAGPVTLLFQPAEEGGHGAKRMIDDGALRGIDAVFGWHNWPAIPFGKAVCPDGAVMGANGAFRIEVKGQGGHASQPESCQDPVLAAAAVALALQQIVSRRMPPQEPVVIGVSSIDASSSPTVIPDTSSLSGTIRYSNPDLRAQISELIAEIASQTAMTYGCKADIEVEDYYAPTINHPDQAAEMRAALAQELGEDWLYNGIHVPIMGSEDFSYYLQQVPGAFALIGADDGNGHHLPCHNAAYDFNDSLISKVMGVYARLSGLSPA